MTERDPYSLLGLESTAVPAQIRAAFRRLVRERHPDTAEGSTDDSALRDLIDAYRILIDPTARARYDALRSPSGSSSPSGTPIVVRHTESHSADSRATARACPGCLGRGFVSLKVGCPSCGGRGAIMSLEVSRVRSSRCGVCLGRGRLVRGERCTICGGSGTVDSRSRS
jgi:DnaJ-class molecular chaperone